MLDYAIVFALGFLIAGLLSFAMLPIVWRRALRLTRRQLEMGIPISMAEVRAGLDHVRAEAAIQQRRLEARVEAERDRRHAVMAENGRQSEALRRLAAELRSKDGLVRQVEERSQDAATAHGEAQQLIASQKAELAAANVNLALRDQIVEEDKREINQLRMDNDGLRVEIVAMRTKLGTAEDEIVQKRREIEELIASGVERDGRIALQGAELATKLTSTSTLESQLLALERKLTEKAARVDALEARQAELEGRHVPFAREIAELNAMLADREGRLAFAAGRERELLNEIARLKNEAQRTAAGLANGVSALREDRQMIAAQLESARNERARLQAEVLAMKRDARESWLAIEGDNRQLRIAMARIAAEIARQSALRNGASLGPIDEIVGNAEASLVEGPRLSLPEPAEEKRTPIEAPQV